MSSPTKARDGKRVPMACTNCRQKKLKVHYRITLLHILRSDFTRFQCRAPDEKQRVCPRCIDDGVPCEYVPVNPSSTTPNPQHHDSHPLQPLAQGSQNPSSLGSIRPYYPTEPINIQWTANSNIDPSLMGSEGTLPNPPATQAGNPFGQSPFYTAGHPPNLQSAHGPNPIFIPQSHGHQGPYLPGPGPQWVDQPRQYGDPQANSSMGRAPYQAQHGQSTTQTGVVWPNSQTNYYQHSGYTKPSGDQR